MISSQMAIPFGGLVYGMLLDRMPSYNLLIIIAVMVLLIIVAGFSRIPKELNDMYRSAGKSKEKKLTADEEAGA